MPLPVWPAMLPHHPHVHSQTEPARGNLESEMAAGNVRQRRRFTVVIGTVEMTIRFTVAQYQTFKAFHRDTLANGSSEFTMPVFDLTGCPNRRVRFRDAGRYSATRIGGRIDVSFALDVWEL